MYKNICESLKPTPAKSHYLFNLRDLSRVIEGMMLLKKELFVDNDSGTNKICRLWIHEICRVFYDRISFEDD